MMHPLLQKQWNRLETLKMGYEKRLEQASAEELAFKPSPDSWNMLQVVRHLLTVEELSMAYLIKKNYTNAQKRGSFGTRFRALLLRLMLKSPLKFKAPPLAALQAGEEQDSTRLLVQWQAERKKLAHYLENFPEEKLDYEIYRHPRSGWLTIGQTLQFFGDHLEHHQQQMDRIRKAGQQEKAKMAG